MGGPGMTLVFDPTLRSFADERQAVYRRLRDETPVFWDEARSTYVLSRFADVFDAASGDPREIRLRENVWPAFLSDNARPVSRVDQAITRKPKS
jgi:hypothetical protein